MSAEAEIRRVLDRLLDAWNRRDSAAFARLFTPDADYVTGDGSWVHGRGEIGSLVRDAEAGTKASLVGHPSIRAAEDWATVISRWSAVASDGSESRGVMSCVLVREKDRWLVDRLQNTDETTSR